MQLQSRLFHDSPALLDSPGKAMRIGGSFPGLPLSRDVGQLLLWPSRRKARMLADPRCFGCARRDRPERRGPAAAVVPRQTVPAMVRCPVGLDGPDARHHPDLLRRWVVI